MQTFKCGGAEFFFRVFAFFFAGRVMDFRIGETLLNGELRIENGELRMMNTGIISSMQSTDLVQLRQLHASQ
jgi:hypothetical protein